LIFPDDKPQNETSSATTTELYSHYEPQQKSDRGLSLSYLIIKS